MTYTRTRALGSPVSLDDAMTRMRLDAGMEWEAQTLIDAAAAEIEAYCEIALLRQTISVHVTAQGEGGTIALPVGPLAPGGAVTVDGVTIATGISEGRWPSITLPDGVTGPLAVTYEAGFGDTPASVPADLQLALMDHAARLYDMRGAQDVPQGLSPAAARICARYRRVRA